MVVVVIAGWWVVGGWSVRSFEVLVLLRFVGGPQGTHARTHRTPTYGDTNLQLHTTLGSGYFTVLRYVGYVCMYTVGYLHGISVCNSTYGFLKYMYGQHKQPRAE